MKPAERELARALRRDEGLPLRAIADRVGVSKSSVSRWVRDIELTEEQHATLRALNPLHNAQLRGRQGRRHSARAARIAAQEHGRALARRGELLHAQGCMLYWAEGSKNRNVASLSNSDAGLVALFIRFLSECYAVAHEKMALTVQCHTGGERSADEIVDWWLERLALPACCRRVPVVNRTSRASLRRRGHVLPFGTARVSVYSTFVVQSIFGAIQAYSGCEQPAWLD